MKNPLIDPSNKTPTLLNKKKGAAMVEYAIMIGLVALVAFAVVKTLGTKVNSTFNSMASSFPAQNPGNSGQGNSGKGNSKHENSGQEHD
ncbi:MAG: Flp family type IVb pilin [Methylococcaceae bacterium]